MCHLIEQLRIELVVLHRRLEVDVSLSNHTDETARAAGVNEWCLVVGGANERRIATMAAIGLAVWWAVFQIGCRHEVFQHNLLALGNLVKLVEVDKCKRRQSEVQVRLVLEVDAVVVIFALVARQQDATERRLAAALATY